MFKFIIRNHVLSCFRCFVEEAENNRINHCSFKKKMTCNCNCHVNHQQSSLIYEFTTIGTYINKSISMKSPTLPTLTSIVQLLNSMPMSCSRYLCEFEQVGGQGGGEGGLLLYLTHYTAYSLTRTFKMISLLKVCTQLL